MSACDRRTYRAATCGLFKLRASDGDLAWECRPVDANGTGAGSYRNLGVTLLSDGRVLIIGPYLDPDYGTIMRAMMITETGGLLSAIQETESVDAPVSGFTGSTMHSRVSVTDEYIYLSGQSAATASNKVITKFAAADGSFIEQRTFLNCGGSNGFSEAGGEAVDVFQGTGVTPRINRYDTLNGSVVSSSAAVGSSLNQNGQMIQDENYYYMGNVTAFARTWTKLRKSDLTTADQSTDTGGTKSGTGNVRGGYIASPLANSVICHDTDLNKLFQVNFGVERALSASPCSSFVVSARVNGALIHPGIATLYKVRRHDFTGATVWETDILASNDRDIEWELWPRVMISEDESQVYFYGSVSHDGIAGDLKMAIYCLDATTGGVLWCFSPGPVTDIMGTNVHAGLSLLESGDDLYLSTLRSRGPTYR
jgi:outer membrane protein assembly factor BamB